MNALYYQKYLDQDTQNEMEEFFRGIPMGLFFAESVFEVLEALNSHTIDWLIMPVTCIEDTSIIKFIEERHGRVKVIILTNEELMNAVRLLNQENIICMQEPLKLMDLRDKMTA
jgi:DNA-binding NtrC family response regulator